MQEENRPTFKYLKLTNDDTESMNAESEEFCFKFNPCHFPRDFVVGDITDDLGPFFQRFGVNMDEDVSTLQFYLYQDGNIGPCS